MSCLPPPRSAAARHALCPRRRLLPSSAVHEPVPAASPRPLKPRCSPSPPTWTSPRRCWICWSARCAWSAWTPRPRCCRASTPSAAAAWRTSSARGTSCAARSAASWWTAGWTTCPPTSCWSACWTASSSGRSEAASAGEEEEWEPAAGSPWPAAPCMDTRPGCAPPLRASRSESCLCPPGAPL